MAFWRHIRLPSQADPRLFRQFQGEVRRISLPRTRLRTSLPCSKRRGFKKGVEHIVPANGAFILPVSLWGGPYLQR
jgi:hypothetical protein